MPAIVKIQSDYRSLDEQKVQIVYAWLQRKDIIPNKQSQLPTWSELATAVDKESTALARSIRLKYCEGSS